MAMNEQLIQKETSQADYPLDAPEIIDHEKQVEFVNGKEEIKICQEQKLYGLYTSQLLSNIPVAKGDK